MKTKINALILAIAVTLFCGSISLADDSVQRDHVDDLLSADLVRIADLAVGAQIAGPVGTDPLSQGHVDVSRSGQVDVVIKGAVANAPYDVHFCPEGSILSGCVSLGTVTTDSEGGGQAQLQFSSSPTAWAGSFILTRNNASQFISGFKLPPADEVPAGGTEVELKGKVSAVNPSMNSFRLENLQMDILVGSSTVLEGFSSLDKLTLGQFVEVKGFSRNDGSMFATRVQIEDRLDNRGGNAGQQEGDQDNRGGEHNSVQPGNDQGGHGNDGGGHH
jgi:hypothetical protein